MKQFVGVTAVMKVQLRCFGRLAIGIWHLLDALVRDLRVVTSRVWSVSRGYVHSHGVYESMMNFARE